MRAIVIGGTGGMGQGVARDLIKQEKITSVTLGDINIDPGRSGCKTSYVPATRHHSPEST